MLDVLRGIAGDDALLDGAALSAYTVHGVRPAAVVAPASTEVAATLLQRASAEGWHVGLAGGGSRGSAGRPPGRVDVVITTQRMSGVAEYEPADLTASVRAGTRLGDLAGRVAAERQTLPLDPPGWRRATLGGVIATGCAGPLRLTQGTPRDHVLGLELVTGDGRVLQLGGKVVKNVAGYDLVKLVVGSHGTLGLVTAAHVRLRPLPEADRTMAIVAREGSERLAGLASLVAARVQPAAAELVSPALTREIGLDVPGWALFARFLASPGAVADAELRLAPALRTRESGILSPEAAETVWSSFDEREARAPIVVRLASLPTHLDATLAAAERVDGTRAPWVLAHAGEGIVRLLIQREDAGLAERIEDARRELEKEGGSVIIAQGTPALMQRVDPWGEVGAQQRLMEELKQTFDPAGVLAPGRFVV
jgi:glycolate oxidase FAD binding subunit